jgi:hypothetical protein
MDPVEYSSNVLERRDYVHTCKPAHEQRIRGLACQVIPADHIPASLNTAWQALNTAGQALNTAGQALNTAWQAGYDTAGYDTAGYDTAHQAYDTAGQAYETAWQALNTAGQALNTAWLSMVLPNTPWAELYDEANTSLRLE